MDSMRSEAWRDVVGDAKEFYESHPFVVLIGGAVLGSALVSRSRPPEKKRGILGLLKMASFWIGPAIRAVRSARPVEEALN
jgi:hypothetical protein